MRIETRLSQKIETRLSKLALRHGTEEGKQMEINVRSDE